MYLSTCTCICIHVKEGGFRQKETGRLTKITDGERLSLFHILFYYKQSHEIQENIDEL